MPRSSSPRGAIPPTDHVARELLKRGARDPAMQLLRAAVRRDPGERACAALIKALEARPDAAVSGPELLLDLPLIDAYVARGMLLEARAVLAGAGLEALPAGAERARVLDELLAPTPRDAEPALVEALRHVMTGGASLSLSLLEEHVQQGHALPQWAARSRAVLRRLLLDDVPDSAASGAQPATAVGGQPTPPSAASAATSSASASSELALAVGRLISERDLRGAAARLEQHCAGAQSDAAAAAGAAALRRLVRALDVRDGTPAETVDSRTMPMGPQKVADLNLRMGNLPEAERLYRRVLLDEPENVGLRAMLDDVQAVRRFLDPPAAVAATPLAGVRRSLIDAAVADIAVRPTEPLPVTAYDPSSDGPEELPRMYTDIAGGAPSGADTADVPTRPDEVTRRVLSSDLARAAAATLPVDPQAQRPSSPGLSKRGAGPSSGGFGVATGYGPAKTAAPAGNEWDDDATGILEPAVEAELLLKQGFPDRALRVYRMLAEMSPANEKFRRRVAEIEALIASERVPMPGDLTVRRDVSDLQKIARPTAVRVSVPDEVLAAAAAASASADALPGTLEARGIPQGQFDDEPTTRVAPGRDVGSPGDLAVQVTRIVVVR